MNITVTELTRRILSAVRDGAKNEGITQGAIEVRYAPAASFVREWLGLPEEESGDATVAQTFPVIRGGKTTYSDTDGTEKGDCAGVVAMKFAAAKRGNEHHTKDHYLSTMEEHMSGACPDQYNGNGRINWKGSIGFPIGYLIGGGCGRQGADAMTIYVTVSGGTQVQDEAAALKALDVIKEFVNAEDYLILHRSFLK